MDKIENDILGKIFAQDESAFKDASDCPMPDSIFPKQTPLAMAYIPFQKWETPYEPEVGLSRGTIFPSLDKPFIGEEAVSNAHFK